MGQDFAAFNTLSRLLLLSPLPDIMNTNVFQSGSYFLTTHSGAFKFRLPHHCHIPKAVSAAACEGTLLSLAHGGKLGGAKKSCWWYSVGRLSLKQGWLSWHFGRMWRGLCACLLFNFLFFLKEEAKTFGGTSAPHLECGYSPMHKQIDTQKKIYVCMR